MSGITELKKLMSSMNPMLTEDEFVFCTVSGKLSEHAHLEPLASFIETEGLTLVLSRSTAEREGIAFDGIYRQITLTVHSSLNAVGLTAAVSGKLASEGISANVIAAYYHDHIFVQTEKAQAALAALHEITFQNL